MIISYRCIARVLLIFMSDIYFFKFLLSPIQHDLPFTNKIFLMSWGDVGKGYDIYTGAPLNIEETWNMVGALCLVPLWIQV